METEAIIISEDAPLTEILRAIIAKEEGKTVKVVRNKEARASTEKQQDRKDGCYQVSYAFKTA